MADALTGAEVAIVGLSGRFPGARSLDEFWHNLCDGVESIVTYSEEELLALGADPALVRQPGFVKAAARLDQIDGLDAALFGYNPREVELMDPQHRVFLECAWEALESAGYGLPSKDMLVGVFGGAALSTYLLLNLISNPQLRARDPLQLNLGNAGSFMVTRVAYKLNLKGPSFFVESACSTSLVAVHVACQSLLNGECDLALAGGVSINLSQQFGYRYIEGSILSPDGHCRPFDAEGQGIVFGSGAGVVALRRLEDALKDGDFIHAVIKGSAVNNDGAFKVGYTAPAVDGQAEVISEALGSADVGPETIAYIETHGTGTPLGDPIELQALKKAFGGGALPLKSCAIGSVKANVGHLDAAAGVTGLIKTTLALRNRKLPPSINFETPNSNIDWEGGPFYVNTELKEWKAAPGVPRRAGVSSFGMGGTNAHVVLEEAPRLSASGASRPFQLLLLSAQTPQALDAMTGHLAAHLRRGAAQTLADVAYTLQVGRRRLPHRRMLVCQDAADAVEGLGNTARLLGDVEERIGRPVAFMFSGQGTQYARMTAGLYEGEPAFREQVDACASLLKLHLGRDLREVLYPANERLAEAHQLLEQTRWAQPALFVVEYALAQLWMAWGVAPQAMIGHSIGEYVAACLAGVFSLKDALALVAARGELMQGLPAGAMLSVALPEEELRPQLDKQLSVAAVNAPAFCVVAGPTVAVEELRARLAGRGVGCRLLKTSHAFHSAMMEPILGRFAERVRQVPLKPPRIPYVSNITGTWITPAEATDPRYWANHLRQPVRFWAGLELLAQQADRVLLEIGPGRTLSTFAAQLPASAGARVVQTSIRHPNDTQQDQAFLLSAMGRLWLAGVEIDWKGFHGDERRQRLPLPTYPFERRRYWIEAGEPLTGRETPGSTAEEEGKLYMPGWQRTPPLPAPGTEELAARPRRWLVLAEEGAVGAALAERLRQARQSVSVVRRGDRFTRDADGTYRIRPREPADYAALMAALDGAGEAPDTVVHLWTLMKRERRPVGLDRRRAFATAGYGLLLLARAAAKYERKEPLRLEIISGALREVSGHEEIIPEDATVLGACLAAMRELPGITSRSIDVVPGEVEPGALVDRLLAELSSGSGEPVIAWRGGRRWQRVFTPVQPGATARSWHEGGTYLLVDGTRNAEPLAALLARQSKARFVRVVPGASEPPVLPESLGEVVTVTADLTSAAAMKAVVSAVHERYHALHGVISLPDPGSHGFGELAENNLLELEAWLDAQGRALEALEAALEGRTLDFCLVCSSAAPGLGSWGRAARELVGAYMDALVSRHSSGGTPWLSLDWEAPGGTPGARAAKGGPEEAVEALHRLIASGLDGSLLLSTADPFERLRPRRPEESHEPSSVSQGGAQLHPRPALKNAYAAPRSEEEKTVAGIWQEVLGIEAVGVHDNFFELGGHSLLATAVVGRLRESFSLTVPLQSLFEAPTVQAMATLIAHQRLAGPEDPEKEALLRMLTELAGE